ncbi:MAG: sensor histidine kinase [Treponema sp.]|nr:sensor histidine kinase [Treponema sp.]
MLLTGTGDAGEIPARIDAFSGSLTRFFTSPVGKLYRTWKPFDEALWPEPPENFTGMLDALKAAVQSGDQPLVFTYLADIDTALARLQWIDNRTADSAQSTYFRLLFFFAMLVILVFLSLILLYRKMENTLSRSRSFSRETLLAQEEERARIARELHDSVAQDLWRLTQKAGGGEAAKEHRALLDKVRQICYSLVPPDFHRQGLPPALRRLCLDFQTRTGIECRLSIQDKLRLEPLGPETQLQCFRLVQEALANIEKHSGSGEAVLVMRNDDAGKVLWIYVSDSGKGFDPRGAFRKEHFGIRDMYERAAIVNGKLTIHSEAGEGTTLSLEVPLEDDRRGYDPGNPD